jgi:HPt (histidine-containing phosphotransfer) domain-containing protein
MMNMSIDGEPIYSSLAADPCMGELVDMYVEETPGRITALEQALASGDSDALRRAAHQMKGAAGSYGFDPLTVAAGALESTLRNNESPETVELTFHELIRLCRRIRAGVAPASLNA